MLFARCNDGESAHEAIKRVFGPGHVMVGRGPGRPNPTHPDMVGIVTIRARESFAVIRRPVGRPRFGDEARSVRISGATTPTVDAHLRARAEREGLSRSQAVHRAVAEWAMGGGEE